MGESRRHSEPARRSSDKDDPGESLFVVREGSVDLRDGDRVIETVGAPGLFGEMALIEDEPRQGRSRLAVSGVAEKGMWLCQS